MVKGNASSDIQCVTLSTVSKPNPPGEARAHASHVTLVPFKSIEFIFPCCVGTRDADQGRPTMVYEVIIAVLLAFFIIAIIIIIIIAAVKIHQNRKKPEKQPTKTPAIRTPTGNKDKEK